MARLNAMRQTPIRRAGNRKVLFMGGERELVMLSGLCAAVLIFIGQTLASTLYGLGLWFAALGFLRKIAKADPEMSKVFWRSLNYKGQSVLDPNTGLMIRGYFPPRSTPYRENTRVQIWRYK
jgi:type IV secretion system protein VirB3